MKLLTPFAAALAKMFTVGGPIIAPPVRVPQPSKHQTAQGRGKGRSSKRYALKGLRP